MNMWNQRYMYASSPAPPPLISLELCKVVIFTHMIHHFVAIHPSLYEEFCEG